MVKMLDKINRNTQKQSQHPIFNNAQVIPEGWYFLCQSKELRPKQIKDFKIGAQKLVVYRGESGKVYTLDSYCAHMGADFKIGKVVAENIQCFFHQWQYAGSGNCVKIPCQAEIPARAKVQAYPTVEKYGAVWCYAGPIAHTPLLEVPDLEGKETITRFDRANFSKGHHHISMINGIDPQHLATVHDLNIQMELEVQEDQTQIFFSLTGDTPRGSWTEKMMYFFIGKRYCYQMKYADACLASLTILKNVYFLKESWKWPALHMFYAYRPLEDGSSLTFPIYITSLEPGVWGKIKSHFRLWLTKRLYYFLKDDDEIIYDNIRFNTHNLLNMDAPVSRYIRYVNKLKKSLWSIDCDHA
ncbi:aromatic ring-hydroxylating dioxygenase subunit alpha [bacterium (Candidatus Blackallbacteria) CG17_big_fil_post_rev_8_21_14_2_50_48_46]|uniref:Aromatic ring-hydroxylating dioxygenase subunit alpha n=1 Tax=bacterium (Candidatus Blackallbacteria) CG17_big_fil_post_rev_8_21_14_2_50_48_46 TaxID=2014261 RepID=A0A2M7FXY8_9BACT|nr:MAG: Rieske (2Fe-2S) protein [bacterium (Candidatus Blackallbacteria) CG18_big_fil_WC_8_21_14_2_50_49_26]PIW14164.1 MAG: aromatic ring-hydroxylating dioxygenase subunit alpha [bacterium (Candidatus Blackallbacteria) CG17_big_fil_post_rev_8_21_14_2_50_48_46]PIW46705.1 MAG: aromatic ring-hydroxylating dioxygenase subunit alpha [bacterium (Candidatus Blackallbacteria) CG13_big_fil_rev_8_21_14_2_50_49_14]